MTVMNYIVLLPYINYGKRSYIPITHVCIFIVFNLQSMLDIEC